MAPHRIHALHNCLILVAMALASLLPLGAPATALAAPRTPAGAPDTVVLKLDNGNGPNFLYNTSSRPTFTAVVTLGTKPTANHLWNITVTLEDGVTTTGGTSTVGTDGLTITYSKMVMTQAIPVGPHTATATFSDPQGSSNIFNSNAVSFTIVKATPKLTCSIVSLTQMVPTGQPLQIRIKITDNANQQGTYSVTLDGPMHLSYTGLVPNSSEILTAAGPTQPGSYTLGCSFSGSDNFTAVTGSPGPSSYLFSAMHSLGGLHLYANPTTLTANVTLEFDVVFQPAPGLPTPTGSFEVILNSSICCSYNSAYIAIAANGNTLIAFKPIATTTNLSQIYINYSGDENYAATSVAFPVTNPAIPGGTSGTPVPGGGSTHGSNPQATATPTAHGTPTATAAATATATANEMGSSAADTTNPPHASSGGAPWGLLPLLLLLFVGGGIGGVALWRARRRLPFDAPATGLELPPPAAGLQEASSDATWPTLPSTH